MSYAGTWIFKDDTADHVGDRYLYTHKYLTFEEACDLAAGEGVKVWCAFKNFEDKLRSAGDYEWVKWRNRLEEKVSKK